MPLHAVPPRLWAALRLREGICARLPAHYLAALQDDTPPTPVHWRPLGVRYRRHPRTGQRERVQDVPVPVHLPRAAHEGLWGGEGWIRGFRYARNDKLSTRLPKTWKPQLFSRQFYSEILDATLTITVTMRTLDLIDEAFGFDFYILKARARGGAPRGPLASSRGLRQRPTPKADMGSKLGMDLKRTMLLRLARKDPKLHPDDPARREAIYHKYREFVIPEEEAEWVGLSLEEAIEKQRLLEKKVSF
ncbi:RM28 protein, partial [Casuarius casuarius]|nr:RM28 protein [Casuarius casuarius]